MTSVLSDICQWASKLPYWEQAALDKILSGVAITDADYQELLRYLLEDAGLEERQGLRPSLQLQTRATIPEEERQPVKLLGIKNLQNVNALMSDQSLSFGSALTAIYGGNGSGKSGYARVLGCAGFTRGDKEILPDVTKPIDPKAVPSADLEVEEGNARRIVPFQVGAGCPEMATFYVFDSTSVAVHLTKSNALSFSPAGLSSLGRLSEVTDEVRIRLDERVQQYSLLSDLKPIFQGDSEVSQLIRTLGSKTNTGRLRSLAVLTPEEELQLTELDRHIAELKSQDVSKKIEGFDQTITDLKKLIERLKNAQVALGDQVVAGINAAIDTHVELQAEVRAASIDQFNTNRFAHTGSPEWRSFVEAARRLAEKESSSEQPYPAAGDECLFCHQPLSEGARDLIHKLWAFLKAEAQAKMEESAARLSGLRQDVQQVDLDFFNDEVTAHRHLSGESSTLVEKITSFLEISKRRLAIVLKAIDLLETAAPPVLPEAGIGEIEKVIEQLSTTKAEIQDKDITKEIADHENALRNLQHRKLLATYLPQIEDQIRKRVWVERAGKVGGSTKHITDKHNELLKKLVTDRYVELFEQTLSEMKRPLKVTAITKGKKGGALKELVLKMPGGAPVDRAKPDKVLSEGEKRAVALADFLTEVALDETSSGVILDDPVTSLDFEWKETIAKRLAVEAKRRQVIVFTHDLHFLHVLKKHSDAEQAPIMSHWIKRGDSDDKPGWVFLDNSPLVERDYRKSTLARGFHQKALKAQPAEQEGWLKQGFGALRTSYEALIVYELFNEVVLRFDERISFMKLSQIAWDDGIAQEIVAKCELLSRYIEGHLHSDAFAALKPTPALLNSEIEEFDVLRKRIIELREHKKASPIGVTMSAKVPIG